jgi:hypothetical protein
MKVLITLVALILSIQVYGQESKIPASCKMYLDETVVTEITKETAIKWCELSPPTVKCADGIIYKLETFKVNFLTLKPFMNYDFGEGQAGLPIKARQAVANANPGDTIILKEATYLDAAGNPQPLPTLSFKIL